MICTFFGHRDSPDSIIPNVREAIKMQVANGTTTFYVGNHGKFDAIALFCLRELKKELPEIKYFVVLAYLPTGQNSLCETIFPEGVEFVPKRFAIDFRNRWMLDRADSVIAYVTHSWGGAAKYVKSAERKGKTVVRIEQ